MNYFILRYKTGLVFAAVLLLLLSSQIAVAGDGARDFVNNLSDQVLSLLRDGSISDADKETKLTQIFDDSVATGWMAKFVLGRHFRGMDDARKKKYLSLYREFLTKSYIPRFKKYTGEKFDILQIRDEAKEVFVQTEIVPTDKEKPSIRVDYRLKKLEAGQYKIIDIIGEGISLITTQRSDFAALISQKGIDHFLQKLEEKVALLNK